VFRIDKRAIGARQPGGHTQDQKGDPTMKALNVLFFAAMLVSATGVLAQQQQATERRR
jgi:hypothetical protein